jgi:LacI family transcriptional regulator
VMLATMIESAAECGYHMLTYIVRNPESAESARTIKEVFHQRRIDGGVFVGFANNIPVVEELVTDGFPVGVFDHTSRGHVYPNRAVANFDDERVAGRAIDYLVGLGHRRIAVIHGDRKRNAGEGRYKGFSLALERNGIKPDDKWIMYGDFGRDNGRTLAGRLLADRSDLPTAVAAVNDAVAFGVIDAASEAGVVVPHELSVIGIDGHPLGPYTTPSLTTFSYDLRAMFRSLVKTVTEIAEGSEPYELHQVFSGTFTERGSCAPPASSID